MKSHWRQIAAPIIARVLNENKCATEKEIKAALKEAYPFGQRSLHPYKIWCDEVAKQRGKKPIKKQPKPEAGPGQIEMFKL